MTILVARFTYQNAVLTNSVALEDLFRMMDQLPEQSDKNKSFFMDDTYLAQSSGILYPTTKSIKLKISF